MLRNASLFKSRKVVIVVFLTLAGLLLYVGPGQAALSSLDASRNKANLIRNEAKALETQIEQAKQVKANEAAYQAALEQARKAIPPTSDLSNGILEIQQAASVSGVNWSSGAPKVQTTSSGVNNYSVDLTVRGSTGQILEFLRQLKVSERLITVDKVTLSGGSGESTGKITVKLYSLEGK